MSSMEYHTTSSGIGTGPSKQTLWTAARCQRILRHMAAATKSAKGAESVLNPGQEPPAIVTFASERGSNLNSAQTHDSDETWIPRKPKRKYSIRTQPTLPSASAKRKRQSTPETTNDEVVLPLDLLQNPAVDENSLLQTPANDSQSSPLMRKRPIRSLVRADTFERLKKAFESTLKSTSCDLATPNHAAGPPPPDRGPASLLNTCLRRACQYVNEEETERRACGEDTPNDVQSEVLDWLEDFSSRLGAQNSWMKRATRSIAVGLMCSLITESAGLQSPEYHCIDFVGSIAIILVNVCLENGAYEEAKQAVSVFVHSNSRIPEARTTTDPLHWKIRTSIRLLNLYTKYTRHRGLLFRTIASLLQSQDMPITWIGTLALRPILVTTLKYATPHGSQTYDALLLLETIFTTASGLADCTTEGAEHAPPLFDPFNLVSVDAIRRDETHELFSACFDNVSDLCVSICAYAFIKSTRRQDDEATVYEELPALRPIRAAAVTIGSRFSCPYFASRVQQTGLAATAALILLADLTVLPHDAADQDVASRLTCLHHVVRLATSLRSLPVDLHGCMSEFILQAAKMCGNAYDMMEDDAYNAFVHHFQMPNGVREKISLETYQLIGAINSDSFEKFWTPAETTPQSTALQLDGAFDPSKALSSSVSKAKPTSGYRWEEGLCEWIAVTPGIGPQPSDTTSKPDSSPLIRRTKSAGAEPDMEFSSPTSAAYSASSPLLDEADATGITEPSPRSGSYAQTIAPLDLSSEDDEDELSLITPQKTCTFTRVSQGERTSLGGLSASKLNVQARILLPPIKRLRRG